MAVLRAERRAEGVAVREGHGVGLDVELARHGEARLLAEEVLRVVDGAVLVRRDRRRLRLLVRGQQRRHGELLAGALAVARR